MLTDKAELLVIAHAHDLVDRDPGLAVYECRDLRITKAAGLDDLAWAICQGNCHRNDAVGFFEYLDKYISGLEAK
jgi:hypothetical protein